MDSANASAILAAVATGFVGLIAYAYQKRAEHLRDHYLDKGLYRVSEGLHRATSVYAQNWQLLIEVTRVFRDTPGILAGSSDLYLRKTMQVDQSLLRIDSARIVDRLLGDAYIWKASQLTFSWASGRIMEIHGMIAGLISYDGHTDEEQDAASRAVLISTSEQLIHQAGTEAERYYTLINYVEQIASMLEAYWIVNDRRAITFKRRQDVNQALSKIKELFAEPPDKPFEAKSPSSGG